MSVLAIVLAAAGAWCLISVPFALLVGRGIRHGEQQHRRARHAAHRPTWARHDRNRR
ncbi:hypothetical protein LG634_24770 [Streptomyces bambusae]|uniref:hypothetical protein n=1 Tax=Streptomyces bambusae TaxID=1550616 RepID=UPI001CFE4C96|nr:hypothetical protein [Streptomyces bambusae]MCB5168027.1 hypothetical protein [Streptomyces bambusae]